MDYEKLYKEALERAREKYAMFEGMNTGDVLEDIFPELRESEDEKIRKMLIEFFGKGAENNSSTNGISDKDILTWLEKQGKESITIDADPVASYDNVMISDKEEPKFKAGDWITNGDYTWKIVEVKPLDYILQSQNGNIVDDTISHVDEQFHSFTIEDAKEGDVLAGKIDGDNYILIFKQVKDGWIETYGHYYDSVDRFCVPSQLFCRDYQGSFTPATKEQRDLLFQKMHEAGYTFDFEKKELKKIYMIDEGKAEMDYCFTKMMNGETVIPTWSKEDDNCLSTIIAEFSKCAGKSVSKDEWMRCNNFLNSLKDRVQAKQEWSEEDDIGLDDALWCCKQAASIAKDENDMGNTWYAEKWLKSLKQRIGG